MPRETERNYAIISIRIFDFSGSANLVPSRFSVASGSVRVRLRYARTYNYIRLIKYYNWQSVETRRRESPYGAAITMPIARHLSTAIRD